MGVTTSNNRMVDPTAESISGRTLDRWLCEGFRRNPNATPVKCRRVLMELSLSPGSIVRVRCPDCGTWSIRETVSRDTEPEH